MGTSRQTGKLMHFLLSMAVILLLSTVLLTTCQRRIYFPRHVIDVPPETESSIPGLERWWLDTQQGQVEAWYIPAFEASPQNPRPAVIFMHGNAELIDFWSWELGQYRNLGIGLLLPEYRGYGRSAGSPSQAAIGEDMAAFAALLSERPEVDGLIYHGRSIGGGVACDLALHHRPRALIIESTFRSLRHMAREYFVPGFVVLDPFDNESALSQLGELPVLIMHGESDTLVPIEHAHHLASAASSATLVTHPGGHNDLMEPSLYWSSIRELLVRAEMEPTAP